MQGNSSKFESWMQKVDDELLNICGLTHNDLADQTWRDWFDGEMSPAEAAREALENEDFIDDDDLEEYDYE